MMIPFIIFLVLDVLLPIMKPCFRQLDELVVNFEFRGETREDCIRYYSLNYLFLLSNAFMVYLAIDSCLVTARHEPWYVYPKK